MPNIIKIVINILLANATPALVEEIRKAVATAKEKSKTTVNPWDDLFFSFLQVLVGKPGDAINK